MENCKRCKDNLTKLKEQSKSQYSFTSKDHLRDLVECADLKHPENIEEARQNKAKSVISYNGNLICTNYYTSLLFGAPLAGQ